MSENYNIGSIINLNQSTEINTQRWYYVKALNNYKKAKNQNYKNRQKAFIQYYTSNHYYF
jgi:hypothetical protein